MMEINALFLKKSLSANCEVSLDSKFLVAVSGGLDSMVLLHLFRLSGLEFEVAHCNFSLRNSESDDDQKLLEEYCSQYQLTLHVVRFDTITYASDNGISIEMAARDLRYAWFRKLVNEQLLNYIVTAHHGDDAIETFFLNLLRGTGVRGLSGMHYKNSDLLKPLLSLTRVDIEVFATQQAIPFRVDSSNNETIYTRNKIRHQIIPVLKQINPSFNNTMQQNMLHLKEIEGLLDDKLSEFKKELVVEEADRVLISIKRLRAQAQKQTLLFELLHPYGFNSSQVQTIIQCLDGESGKQFFSPTHRLIKDRHNILLMLRDDEKGTHFWLDMDSLSNDTTMQVRVFPKSDDFCFSTNTDVAHFDADKVDFPLLVRRWKQGDSFKPLGMSHFKKLSDFFIDQKLSLLQKEELWVVVSGEDIIWVAGHRLDDRFKTTSRTKNVLEIGLLKNV